MEEIELLRTDADAPDCCIDCNGPQVRVTLKGSELLMLLDSMYEYTHNRMRDLRATDEEIGDDVKTLREMRTSVAMKSSNLLGQLHATADLMQSADTAIDRDRQTLLDTFNDIVGESNG